MITKKSFSVHWNKNPSCERLADFEILIDEEQQVMATEPQIESVKKQPSINRKGVK